MHFGRLWVLLWFCFLLWLIFASELVVESGLVFPPSFMYHRELLLVLVAFSILFSAPPSPPPRKTARPTDRQTDRQTDGRADGRTAANFFRPKLERSTLLFARSSSVPLRAAPRSLARWLFVRFFARFKVRSLPIKFAYFCARYATHTRAADSLNAPKGKSRASSTRTKIRLIMRLTPTDWSKQQRIFLLSLLLLLLLVLLLRLSSCSP